jgi:hypothetical protein
MFSTIILQNYTLQALISFLVLPEVFLKTKLMLILSYSPLMINLLIIQNDRTKLSLL